jgi:hypothetical protein
VEILWFLLSWLSPNAYIRDIPNECLHMKKWLPFAVCIALVASSCEKDEMADHHAQTDSPYALQLAREPEPLNGRQPLSRAELVQMALAWFPTKGVFDWQQMNDYVVWSAAIASDSIISLGYQPEGFANIDEHIHEINALGGEWLAIREAIIQYVLTEHQARYPHRSWKREDVLAFGEKPLPYVNLRVWDYDIIAYLRNLSVTRYCEPLGFGIDESTGPLRSDSGCGDNGAAANVPAGDFFISPQGAMVSWNYIPMNIHLAWPKSQGRNITVGLIDTGVSPSQAKLGGQFGTGFSSQRTIEKLGTHVTCSWIFFCSNDGPNDQCGHGTNMAGTLAAPFSADGSPSGVAWRSNLISVRASQDVVVNSSSEKNGVSDAFVLLGNRADLRIISMSMGDLFSSGQLTDAVNYAHNQGKMIFCAAGTSFSFTTFVGVIFPANLANTLAVTGIKTGPLNNMQKCSTCHSGNEVDFVVTMEDANNPNRRPLTLANSGNAPTYTGGSSVATATAAGIAALVWATNTNQSRAQVLDRLKAAGNFYPVRNSQFGWGRIDANAAVEP